MSPQGVAGRSTGRDASVKATWGSVWQYQIYIQGSSGAWYLAVRVRIGAAHGCPFVLEQLNVERTTATGTAQHTHMSTSCGTAGVAAGRTSTTADTSGWQMDAGQCPATRRQSRGSVEVSSEDERKMPTEPNTRWRREGCLLSELEDGVWAQGLHSLQTPGTAITTRAWVSGRHTCTQLNFAPSSMHWTAHSSTTARISCSDCDGKGEGGRRRGQRGDAQLKETLRPPG